MEVIRVQGRELTAKEIEWIRQLMVEHPGWGRFQLSIHLAESWNWRNGAGQLKDMAARTLLTKLERRGLLKLPRRKRGGGSRRAERPIYGQGELFGQPAMQQRLEQLLPVSLLLVNRRPPERSLLTQLLSEHHYLGYRRPVGENLQYLAQDRSGRPVAALVFGAAAWRCAPRDRFIGWSDSGRQAKLHLLANNMRFLRLPWVEVKHLASHVLALAMRRLSTDWQSQYGHPIYLVESFVQQDRFEGSCYRAANWIGVGQTQSRSRNDRHGTLRVPCKDVYVYPLRKDFRSQLQSIEDHRL